MVTKRECFVSFVSVFNGTRAIRCRYLFFFALVFISLSQARDALYSKYGLFFCIYLALTFSIFVSRIIAPARRIRQNHICIHSHMQRTVLGSRSIYVSRNLNGKTIQIHSDDCSFSFRIFSYRVSSGSYFQSLWYLDFMCENSNMQMLNRSLASSFYSDLDFSASRPKNATLNRNDILRWPTRVRNRAKQNRIVFGHFLKVNWRTLLHHV